jgi:hypothetical protein
LSDEQGGGHHVIEPAQAEKLRTLLRALTPKANDPEGIAQLQALSQEWQAMIAQQVRAINDEGYSWSDIARPLGISRTSAFNRYADSPSAKGFRGTGTRRAVSITCPRCGMTSHNSADVAEGYCGNCHDWTGHGTRGHDPAPLEVSEPWRSAAEAEWDGSR